MGVRDRGVNEVAEGERWKGMWTKTEKGVASHRLSVKYVALARVASLIHRHVQYLLYVLFILHICLLISCLVPRCEQYLPTHLCHCSMRSGRREGTEANALGSTVRV